MIAGSLTAGVGAAALAWPATTVRAIGFLFGLNLIVTGFLRAGLLPFVPGYPPLYRVLGVTLGVLTGIIGVLCLLSIAASVVLLLVVVAVGCLLDGLIEVYLAAGNPQKAAAGGWRIGGGLLMIIGVGALLVWPEIGPSTFIFITATVLVFVGIGTVLSAIAGPRTDYREPAD